MCHLPLRSNQEQQKCCIGRKGRISSVSTFESRCDKSRPHLKKESKTDLAPIQKLIYCDCSWPNVKICFYFSSSTFKEVSKKKILQLVKDYVRKLKHHFFKLIYGKYILVDQGQSKHPEKNKSWCRMFLCVLWMFHYNWLIKKLLWPMEEQNVARWEIKAFREKGRKMVEK